MVTRLSSTPTKLRREVTSAEWNLNRMGGDLLTQATNGLDTNLGMGEDLRHANSIFAERPEPSIPPRERVSGINASRESG